MAQASEKLSQSNSEKANLPFSVWSLRFAHFTNDLYSAFIPTIMPILIRQFGLSLALAGFYSSFLALLSSFLQPIFGFLADNSSKRTFIVIGPMMTGVFVSLTAYITESWQLIPLLTLAAIGTASFHPQAVALSGKLPGDEKKRSPSIAKFILFGTIGASLSSVLAYSLLGEVNDIHNLIYAAPIGVLGGLGIFIFVPKFEKLRIRKDFQVQIWKQKFWTLLTLISIVVTRSMVVVSLPIFLPEYFFNEENPTLALGAISILVFHIANAIGSLVGSHLANKIGTLKTLFASFVLAIPLTIIFLESKEYFNLNTASSPVDFSSPLNFMNGSLAYLAPFSLLFLAGLVMNFSQAINVNLAQRLIPENAATVSSLTMGFGWGLATLTMPLIGYFGDLYGLKASLELNALIFLTIGAILVLSLKFNREIQDLL